jgi:hypothetical protein
MFEGILIEKDDAGYPATLTDLDEGRLPDGNVTETNLEQTTVFAHRSRSLPLTPTSASRTP